MSLVEKRKNIGERHPARSQSLRVGRRSLEVRKKRGMKKRRKRMLICQSINWMMMKMKMMVTFRNITLRVMKKKKMVNLRNPIAADLNLDRPAPPQAQGLGPGLAPGPLPVPDQDHVPVQETVVPNQDPAPGRTGVLLPRKKDLTQVPDPLRLQGGARKGAAPDPHPMIAKKGDQDHGQPKGADHRHLVRLILAPDRPVTKRNRYLGIMVHSNA